jgi:hypothetical protein
MSTKNDGRFKKGQHWRKPKPWWDRAWLDDQYTSQGKSAADIAREGGVTENAILFWLKKYGIRSRSMKEIRAAKHWGAVGSDNPMWNKRGELNPMWKGGITPERQAFYLSDEWKAACSTVWKRDKATCRRCGIRHADSLDLPKHIHHIESFKNVALRADPSNLVLLCEVCHWFVHSKRNVDREYLPQV